MKAWGETVGWRRAANLCIIVTSLWSNYCCTGCFSLSSHRWQTHRVWWAILLAVVLLLGPAWFPKAAYSNGASTDGAAGNIIFSLRKASFGKETARGYVNFFLLLQAWKLSQVWSSGAGFDWAVCLGTSWTHPAWENLCCAMGSAARVQPWASPNRAWKWGGWPEGLCNEFSLPYQHVADNSIVSVHQNALGREAAEMRFAFWCKCPAQALAAAANTDGLCLFHFHPDMIRWDSSGGFYFFLIFFYF